MNLSRPIKKVLTFTQNRTTFIEGLRNSIKIGITFPQKKVIPIFDMRDKSFIFRYNIENSTKIRYNEFVIIQIQNKKLAS